MKKNIFLFTAVLGLASLFSSCEKGFEQPVLEKGVAPVLVTPDGSLSYVFTKATENNTFETFMYDEATYGIPVVVDYILEVDKEGGDFSAPIEVKASSTDLHQTVSIAEFNIALLKAGVPFDAPAKGQARIKASTASSDAEILYSNVVTLDVECFDAVPASLYIVGDATPTGWDNNAATEVAVVPGSYSELSIDIHLFASPAKFRFLNNQGAWDNDHDWNFFTGGVVGAQIEDDGSEQQIGVVEEGDYNLLLNLDDKTLVVTKL